MKMRITSARQNDRERMILATVEFEDKVTSTVFLPDWATKADIQKEAQRLRDIADDRQTKDKRRKDLEDPEPE